MFKVDMTGVKELQTTIRQLAKTVDLGLIEADLRRGADIVTREIAKRAPQGKRVVAARTGESIDKKRLKDAAVTRVLKRRNNQPASVISAVDVKAAPHAPMVERGTPPRRVQNKRSLYSRDLNKFFGEQVGRMPKQIFFKPAVDATMDEATRVVLARMGNRIDKAVE